MPDHARRVSRNSAAYPPASQGPVGRPGKRLADDGPQRVRPRAWQRHAAELPRALAGRARVVGRPRRPLPSRHASTGELAQQRAIVATHPHVGKPLLLQHAPQRRGRKEPYVRITPGLLNSARVPTRVPAAEEGEIGAPPPVGNIGRGDHDRRARAQHTGELGHGVVGSKQVLEHLDARSELERAVFERQVLHVLDRLGIQPACARRRTAFSATSTPTYSAPSSVSSRPEALPSPQPRSSVRTFGTISSRKIASTALGTPPASGLRRPRWVQYCS